MNLVAISGNLTRDVETRFLPNGNAVANFTIANNRKWKDQAGQLKEEVAFIGVVAFGKQAEVIGHHFKKGSPILVQGRLKQETWTDKQTQKEQRKTVVVLESFDFMGGNRSDARNSCETFPEIPESLQKSSPAQPKPARPAAEEDDVPF